MAVTPYEEKKYIQSDAVTQAQQALQNQQTNKPGEYQSQWQGKLDDLSDQIQNRPSFSYDVKSDALYQQVAQNYMRQGQQAMMDTMGQASAMTGGYSNSYAQTAGQQIYNEYLQGLTDLVPQYQQMALQQYQLEGENLLNQYNMLMQQEDSAYNRWMDTVNQYYADLDRLQNAYDTERNYDYNRFVDDRNYDYGKYQDELNQQYRTNRDKVADEQWLQQLLYQQERDKIADEQWQKEYEESIRQYNQNYNLQLQQMQQAAARAASSGGVRGSSVDESVNTSSGTMSLPMAAAQVAKQYSVEDAVDWINSQSNVSQAEKNAAIANAKGVSQTEYYRKMAEAMAKKKKY